MHNELINVVDVTGGARAFNLLLGKCSTRWALKKGALFTNRGDENKAELRGLKAAIVVVASTQPFF